MTALLPPSATATDAFDTIIAREFGAGGAALGFAQRVEMYTHRRCAPERAALVYRLCQTDRGVLPRWHQDDRGRNNAHRGHRHLAPPGAYSRIISWTSRQYWLSTVVPAALATPEGQGVLRAFGVNVDTFKRWATVKSGYAGDQRSGRRVVVRPDTVASVLGVTERTVQRCNAAARQLGLEVVILQGRMLNVEERAALRPLGSRQRGLATESAFTIPHNVRRLVSSVTPSRGSSSLNKSPFSASSFPGASAEKKAGATRRQPRHKGVAWALRARGIAAELIQRLSWLEGEGSRRLVPALARFVKCDIGWSTEDLVVAVNGLTWERGPIDPEGIRTRPAVLLAALLRRLDPVLDHPTLGGSFARNPISGTLEPVVVCDRAECDGYGWINSVDAAGYNTTQPCPNCSPMVRSSGYAQAADDHSPIDPDENPF